MSTLEELEAIVTDQLHRLAARGIGRSLEHDHKLDPLDLPELWQIVRQLSGDATLSVESIKTVTRSTVEALPVGGIRGIEWRTAGEILFFPDSDLLKDQYKANQRDEYYLAVRQQLLAAADHMSSKDMQRQITLPLRRMMAQTLVRAAHPELVPETNSHDETQGLAVLSPVPRPRLLSAIREALVAGVEPTIVWGESGNGKTTLCRQILADPSFASARTVTLRHGRTKGSDFDIDLIAALRAVNAPSADLLSFETRISKLRSLLAEADVNSIYFFDNLDPKIEKKLFAELTVAPRVLISQRQEPAFVQGRSIEVREYDEIAEAITAANAILPAENQVLLEDLVTIVGRRPIAIDIACRIIAMGESTIGEMLSLLDVDPRSALSDNQPLIGEVYSEPIAAVYAKLAAILRTKDYQLEMAVLDVALWVRAWRTKQHYINVCVSTGVVSSELAVKTGIRKLKRFGVFREETDGRIEVNDLTMALLRQEFVDRIDRTLGAYYRIGLEAMPDIPQPFGQMPWSVFESEYLPKSTKSAVERFRLDRALQVHRAKLFYRAVTAHADIGQIDLGYGESLLWQFGAEWFSGTDVRGRFALAVPSRDDGFLVWRDGLQPIRADQQLEGNIRGFRLLEFGGIRVYQEHYEHEPAPRTTPHTWLNLNPQVSDGREHRWVSMLPSRVAAKFAIPIWTDCGKLLPPSAPRLMFAPESADGSKYIVGQLPLEPCVVCRDRPPEARLDTRDAIAWIDTVVDPESCNWVLGLALLGGYLSRWTNKEWDRGVLKQLDVLLSREERRVPDFTILQAVYILWNALRMLEYEVQWGRGEFTWSDNANGIVELARLREIARTLFDSVDFVHFARRMARAFEELGEPDAELAVLQEAFDVIRRGGILVLEDVQWVDSRLRTLRDA